VWAGRRARERLAAGADAIAAALDACSTRFRPVLMTPLAMIIGMASMAIGGMERSIKHASLVSPATSLTVWRRVKTRFLSGSTSGSTGGRFTPAGALGIVMQMTKNDVSFLQLIDSGLQAPYCAPERVHAAQSTMEIVMCRQLLFSMCAKL
jgi:hypothetical protein